MSLEKCVSAKQVVMAAKQRGKDVGTGASGDRRGAIFHGREKKGQKISPYQ